MTMIMGHETLLNKISGSSVYPHLGKASSHLAQICPLVTYNLPLANPTHMLKILAVEEAGVRDGLEDLMIKEPGQHPCVLHLYINSLVEHYKSE